MSNKKDEVIQIEIGLESLQALFQKGQLCAAEIRGLNEDAKESIRKLCLTACAHRMQCNATGFEHFQRGKSPEKPPVQSTSISFFLEHNTLPKRA